MVITTRQFFALPAAVAFEATGSVARTVSRCCAFAGRHARGLRFVRDRLGERLSAGVLFDTDPLTALLLERVWVVPVAALSFGTSFQPESPLHVWKPSRIPDIRTP